MILVRDVFRPKSGQELDSIATWREWLAIAEPAGVRYRLFIDWASRDTVLEVTYDSLDKFKQSAQARMPVEGASRKILYLFDADVFDAEKPRIENRRKALDPKADSPSCPQETVGLALSGGGIRSATFSLGVLQSLASRGLLQKFDYLSTVSGGGYIGCYLGSLFLPKALRQRPADPPPKDLGEQCKERCSKAYEELKESSVPTAPPARSAGVRPSLLAGMTKEDKNTESDWCVQKSFDWLRANGRYLAPRGAGDLIFVIAMQIRNWAAVQYVVGIVIVASLVFFATFRAWMIAKCPWWQAIEVHFLPKDGAAIYWSPGWALVGAFGLLFVVPPALAYWVAHSRVERKQALSWLPLWHEYAIIFFLLLGLTWAYAVFKVQVSNPDLTSPFQSLPHLFWVAVGYVVISLCAIGVFLAGCFIERWGWKLFWVYSVIGVCLAVLIGFIVQPRAFFALRVGLLASGLPVAVLSIVYLRRYTTPKKLDLKSLRTRFTRGLRWTFQAFLCAAGLALLGTIGQTVYAYVRLKPEAGAFAGLTSLVFGLVAGARQLFKWMGTGTNRVHPMIPVNALAASAAVLLLLLTGSAWAFLVQSALWSGGPPPAVPIKSSSGLSRDWHHAGVILISPWGPSPDSIVLGSPGTPLVAKQPEAFALVALGTPLVAGKHVVFAVGSLGTPPVARRPVKIALGWMTVLLAGVLFLCVTTGLFLNFLNMSSLHRFYADRLTRAYLGATNRDRFKSDRVEPVTSPLPTDTIPLEAYYHAHLAAPVHLINVTVNQTRPSKGQLVQRDRKGTSMVIGPQYTVVNSAIFERSDTERSDTDGMLTPKNSIAATLAHQDATPALWRPFRSEQLDLGDWCAISGAAFSTGLGMRTSLGLSLLAGLANVRLGYWWNFNIDRWREALLPAYRYLWGELMADFKGPWKPFWFLTDGGHFDNTGVYELVRRRVGVILLCDNGCDPDYRFDNLGNLARKIRTDFGAEMLPIPEANWWLLDARPRHFATAKEFADPKKRKGKCALLYEIRYPSEGNQSLLIVLKPNLTPDTPIDVVEYASANVGFPHQTTLDQFFDDAQWESYRKLGQVIADAVLEENALLLDDGWRESLLPQLPVAPANSQVGVESGA